jgi:hypothetical protein
MLPGFQWVAGEVEDGFRLRVDGIDGTLEPAVPDVPQDRVAQFAGSSRGADHRHASRTKDHIKLPYGFNSCHRVHLASLRAPRPDEVLLSRTGYAPVRLSSGWRGGGNEGSPTFSPVSEPRMRTRRALLLRCRLGTLLSQQSGHQSNAWSTQLPHEQIHWSVSSSTTMTCLFLRQSTQASRPSRARWPSPGRRRYRGSPDRGRSRFAASDRSGSA